MAALLFILGLILLTAGAEILVRGAARLAAAVGISPLVVGLTVVAFGTSAPEMAVSVQAALGGQTGADLAVGNVVGSNIFNILFILGLAAAIAPLVVAQQLVRIDIPILTVTSVLAAWLAIDGVLGRMDGLLLFSGIIVYTAFLIWQSRKESSEIQQEYADAYPAQTDQRLRLVMDVAFVIVGLALLVIGANWLVDGAIIMARALGVGELVIGLTIVAAGTSLPEAATSIMAGIKGERDIAVGNVIGSCLFNVLAVLGLAALLAPAGVQVAPSALRFDIPVMIATMIACLPIFFTGYTIARWEGFVFLGYYIAYTAFLIMTAAEHDALATFSIAMRWFILPLTVLTLMVTATRQLRRRRR